MQCTTIIIKVNHDLTIETSLHLSHLLLVLTHITTWYYESLFWNTKYWNQSTYELISPDKVIKINSLQGEKSDFDLRKIYILPTQLLCIFQSNWADQGLDIASLTKCDWMRARSQFKLGARLTNFWEGMSRKRSRENGIWICISKDCWNHASYRGPLSANLVVFLYRYSWEWAQKRFWQPPSNYWLAQPTRFL